MDALVRNLKVVWRAESIVADARMRTMARRSALWIAAAGLALFGYVMCNIAIFFALQQPLGPMWAAAVVGAGNFAIAGLLALVAARAQPGREVELAQEVRDMALAELETEARALQAQFVGVRDDLRGLQRSFGNFVRHPLDAALPQLVVPLAGLVLKALRKGETPKS
ncbi:MAG TPA: hypothetical protein PKA55_08620 [Rhodoblastus sp.]|nr:hypothetical protein [Rhodoblastus sp.]